MVEALRHRAGKFRSLDRIRKMKTPEALDTLLFDDLRALHAARQILGACIIGFVDEISDEQLAENLDYQNFQGNSYSDQLALLVQHLFNHQPIIGGSLQRY